MTIGTASAPEASPLHRAQSIARAGGLTAALACGAIPTCVTTSLAEALILGLLKQGVRKYFAIFGHGNTTLGDILRQYEAAGVVRTFQFRNEVAMAHAATQLSWQYGEVAAVLTSIGPGALHAFAGSLAAASNGVGVYHLYGDATTFGEGYNMQQLPRRQQGGYGALTALMGGSYTLHTPEALRDALRQGAKTVWHPYKAGPFFMLMPINTQPRQVTVNLDTLPQRMNIEPTAPVSAAVYKSAVELLTAHDRVAIKVGGGARRHSEMVRALAERVGAAVVLSPGTTGVMPDDHPQNMHVGGSKGSISGNFAMERATLLVTLGSRAVCQSDCSGIGYPNALAVINVNGDIEDATHYANTIAIVGDVGAVCARLLGELDACGYSPARSKQEWLATCQASKAEWRRFKQSRLSAIPPADDVWGRCVLTQPQAIAVVSQFAKSVGAVKLFDAGDVQANGFQTVEDDRPFETFTETGASYMGFAVSALMAGAAADNPVYTIALTGDGSFMMNPQILIDAAEHRLRAMIVIFDNRRMAAISSLQRDQYGVDYRTNDAVAVDYLQLASSVKGVLALDGGTTAAQLQAALARARQHEGLAVLHVPVYGGGDPIGGYGAFGSWNVGSWCESVQARLLEQHI